MEECEQKINSIYLDHSREMPSMRRGIHVRLAKGTRGLNVLIVFSHSHIVTTRQIPGHHPGRVYDRSSGYRECCQEPALDAVGT